MVADRGWAGLEEQVEWEELCQVVWRLIWQRPLLLDRQILVLLGERMNDAWVARELKVSESRVRRRRRDCFEVLRKELEERGYFRETRPRQPGTDRWGFITTRKGEREKAGFVPDEGSAKAPCR